MLELVLAGTLLCWVEPTKNENGSDIMKPLTYEIHYGRKADDYDGYIPVQRGIRREDRMCALVDLPGGTYVFSMKTVDGYGRKSPFAKPVRREVH